MNRWKLGFWICLLLLVGVSLVGAYSILDQGVTLTYLRESCDDTEKDLNTLIELVNHTNLSKEQIIKKLQTHDLAEFMDFRENTIDIHRVTLIFANDRLEKIEKQW
jgi:hypothetical protein